MIFLVVYVNPVSFRVWYLDIDHSIGKILFWFSLQPAVVAMNVRHVTDQTALPIFTAVFHQCLDGPCSLNAQFMKSNCNLWSFSSDKSKKLGSFH